MNSSLTPAFNQQFIQVGWARLGLVRARDALNHARSVLNDTSFWSQFPRKHGDTVELAEPYRLKFLAMHLSGGMAYKLKAGQGAAAATTLMTGPVADLRHQLKADGNSLPESVVISVMRAMQEGNALAKETTSTQKYLEKDPFKDESEQAFEALFTAIFDRHERPDLCEMQIIYNELAPSELDVQDRINWLERVEKTFHRVRSFKGHLNEDTYGHRLEKAKGNARKQIIAEQASRRCHLAWRLAELHEYDEKLFRDLAVQQWIDTFVQETRKHPVGSSQRLVAINNALAFEVLRRSIMAQEAALYVEERDNKTLFGIARDTAREVCQGKIAVPEVFHPGAYVC